MVVCKIWFLLQNLVAFISQKEKNIWFFDEYLLTCSVQKNVTHLFDAKYKYVFGITPH